VEGTEAARKEKAFLRIENLPMGAVMLVISPHSLVTTAAFSAPSCMMKSGCGGGG
jgi:hypothetical protein